jgi:hypothetical protein
MDSPALGRERRPHESPPQTSYAQATSAYADDAAAREELSTAGEGARAQPSMSYYQITLTAQRSGRS